MEHEYLDEGRTATHTVRAPRPAGKTLNMPIVIVLALVAALGFGVLLSSLSAPPRLAVLDRPATDADTLPEGVSPLQKDGFTVRFAAEDEGIRYFVSGDQDRQTLCVTVAPDNHPSQWSTGCGSGTTSTQEIVRTSSSGIVTAVLVPDGYDAANLEDEGFKKVHENVYAARTPRVPGSR